MHSPQTPLRRAQRSGAKVGGGGGGRGLSPGWGHRPQPFTHLSTGASLCPPDARDCVASCPLISAWPRVVPLQLWYRLRVSLSPSDAGQPLSLDLCAEPEQAGLESTCPPTRWDEPGCLKWPPSQHMTPGVLDPLSQHMLRLKTDLGLNHHPATYQPPDVGQVISALRASVCSSIKWAHTVLLEQGAVRSLTPRTHPHWPLCSHSLQEA